MSSDLLDVCAIALEVLPLLPNSELSKPQIERDSLYRDGSLLAASKHSDKADEVFPALARQYKPAAKPKRYEFT